MEERELPVGWAVFPLEELIDRIEAGKNFRCIERPPLDEEIGVVKVSAVSWGRFREEESKTVPPGVELDPETRICEGDLLFSRANTIELVGACVMVEMIAKDLRLSDKILRLVVADQEIKPWIYRYLSSPEARKYLSETSSGNQLSMRNISQKVLLKTTIPLAPLNEQRRIAAKLDTTLAAVDACRQRLDGVAELLKRFRQSVLAAATSGELTREWREERGRDHSMEETRLGEVILEMRNGLSPKPTMNPPGVKILRIGAVRSGSIDWEDHRYLELSAKEVTAFGLQPDDLLFTRYNGTLEFVGVCARVGEISDQYVYPDKLIRGRCDPGKVLPAYVEIAFESDNVRSQVESLVKSSAGQKGISGGDLKVIRFSLPLIDEQQEIVRRAQELFTLADQLEARLNSARKVVDRLTPALLAKTFRGELVPQDPEDEPASELLARIRAARQAGAGAAKPSRRGRPKAAANPVQLNLDAAPVPSDSPPPDLLASLLRECGPLSERALLAASELKPKRFRVQLAREQELGAVRESRDDGQVLLEAVG